MNNSIFQNGWWLDCVAPGRWSEVTVTRGDTVVARLPYVTDRQYGFSLLTMPPLTQTLGPWLRSSEAKYAKQLAEQKELLTDLIRKLPRYDLFCQNFHYAMTNWLPFYWEGFSQTTKYTYVLDDLSDEQKIWNNFQENIRREIRKAQNRYHLQIRTDLGLERFLDINALSFKRQGSALPYSRTLVRRIDEACEKRDARRMLFAVDGEDKVHSAIYMIWDEHSAYYLMGGADPAVRQSGAMALLMWEAIRFASTVTRRFDFEGSMIEPVERFFRGFGARQMPYFQIRKINSRILKLKESVNMIAAIAAGKKKT
jgi:hypothetical protein